MRLAALSVISLYIDHRLRSTPSLSEIEPCLREITDAYHLGIHLKVPTEKLKLFETEHPRDIARQRTEIITYWHDNCSNTTWEDLAAAVNNLGHHTNLVKRLRELAQEFSRKDEDMAGNAPFILIIRNVHFRCLGMRSTVPVYMRCIPWYSLFTQRRPIGSLLKVP